MLCLSITTSLDDKSRAGIEGDESEIEASTPDAGSSLKFLDGDEVPDHLEEKFTVAPRAVAVAGGIFGVACLTALAIVAGTNGADGLSTIALALAILAFVIQILVFIAQAQSSSQQMLRSEQLNTQTRALLVEMQATARSTHAMVGEQFRQVLGAFMDAAKTAEGKGGFDQDAFERRLMANIRREQQGAGQEGSPAARRLSGGTVVGRRGRTVLRPEDRFDSGPFPSEQEAQPVIDLLTQLPTQAKQRLKEYGLDKEQTAGGTEGYMGFSTVRGSEIDQDLLEKGLLRIVRLAEGEGPGDGLVYQLTDLGDLAANVLGSSGEVPGWAAPIVVSGDR
jgi:hypothetical protein